MQGFVYSGGWFDHYRPKLAERYETFKVALNLLLQFGGKHIVETGTMRAPGNWYFEGCSTYLFGEFADRYGLHLWTCDVDERTIENARAWTMAFDQRITYVCRDSVEFLSRFADTIDLLYLDSMDCPPEGDATAAQEHNLRELIAALPHLSRRAIVLLDDNAFPNGGKTRRAKAHLLEAGWLCLLDSRQSLWLRPCREDEEFPGQRT
jgi:predicted O-methyltransferase YrrM